MRGGKATIKEIDEEVPKLAKAATPAAYKRALRVGSVLVYRKANS